MLWRDAGDSSAQRSYGQEVNRSLVQKSSFYSDIGYYFGNIDKWQVAVVVVVVVVFFIGAIVCRSFFVLFSLFLQKLLSAIHINVSKC